MPRAFWKGAISFGLVAIPVKMYVGTESKPLSFHLLHKKCLTRPKQVLHCETDDEYFGVKETVRGYEVAKEQYVVMDDSDFEKVPIKTSHTIDILGFVEAGEIDPLYYYGVHYLEPEELGTKPFQLLKEALLKTGRVGVGKVTFQRREHLVCLRPLEDIIVLHSLHYEAEILPRKEISPPKTKATDAELDMAVSLVKAMEKSFKPDDYKDEYQHALKKVIDAKIKGEKIVALAMPKAEIGDLMAALRASVEAAKKAPVLK
ncbi:MAG: Ku protein [Dehalococcoidales bacterium]|nr:Ku protein [Dehalococcoidales bacterium]